MTFKHSASSLSSKKTEIHLIRGQWLDGMPTYAYLALYAHRVRDLKLSLITKSTDLEKFGVILKIGIGEPDNATKKYIKETFLKNKADIESETITEENL